MKRPGDELPAERFDFRQSVRISPLASARSLNELQALGAGGPKTEQEAFKQGVLELLK